MKDEAMNIGLTSQPCGPAYQSISQLSLKPGKEEIQKRMVAILEMNEESDPDKGKEER